MLPQAIDGIVTDASRWSAMVTTAKPENTVTFDFGEIRCVSSVDIAFYASSARKYDFDIEVSTERKYIYKGKDLYKQRYYKRL